MHHAFNAVRKEERGLRPLPSPPPHPTPSTTSHIHHHTMNTIWVRKQGSAPSTPLPITTPHKYYQQLEYDIKLHRMSDSRGCGGVGHIIIL